LAASSFFSAHVSGTCFTQTTIFMFGSDLLVENVAQLLSKPRCREVTGQNLITGE
jgi:predicted phage tail protein